MKRREERKYYLISVSMNVNKIKFLGKQNVINVKIFMYLGLCTIMKIKWEKRGKINNKRQFRKCDQEC